MKKRKRGWYTCEELCALFDCSRAYFDRELRRLIPEGETQKDGRRNLYRGRAVLEAWSDHRAAAATKRRGTAPAPPKQGAPPSDEDLWAGDDSPELRRYRRLKGDELELDLAERRGELLSREDVHRWLATGGAVLRTACDTLQRQFGRDAYRIIDQALSEFERQIEESLSVDGDTDGVDAGAQK